MSSRDSIIRIRPRKDKDRDGDKRSSIAGTGGIIVKKHRDSMTARSVAPSDSASQVCTETQSQPSRDMPSPESAATSPLLQSSSAVSLTSRTPLSSIQTPATLRPYLETEAGDAASLTIREISSSTNEVKEGWDGPAEEAGEVHDDSVSSSTPKPMRSTSSETKRKGPGSRSPAGPEGPYENPFLSSQMANSFHSATTNTAPTTSPHTPMPAQPYRPSYPQPPSSPAPTWHDAPSQRPSSVISGSRSVTSDPSSTATYIAHAQPRMVQPQENPVMLLQRVSNAMPDIYMLMQHFHESCATLGMRENHIRQLEMQREADAKRQDNHIDKLSREIEAMIAKHAAKVERLEARISKLEESKASLQKSLAKEAQLKEDAKASNENLRAEQKQLTIKYLEEREAMTASHSKEKTRLISDHAANQRTLSDHYQAQVRTAEADMSTRLGDLNRLHEQERQAAEERRARERRDLEEGHAQIRGDLEVSLATKAKIIEDERRDCARMRQTWEKEHEEWRRRHDEERVRHRIDLEEQFRDLGRKHQKEKDEVVKTMEASHTAHQAKYQAVIQEHERALETLSRHAAEAQNTISRLHRDAESQKRYTSDAQEAFRKLQKENADVRSALETATSRQQQLELQDRTRRIHSDNDIQNRSRTPSRQRSDPQESAKLRKELENERGRNEDAQDTINKLRRDLEGLKLARNNAEKKQVQSSSQRTSVEGKSPLQKTTSNESSGSQKQAESAINNAAKSKNVTWQT